MTTLLKFWKFFWQELLTKKCASDAVNLPKVCSTSAQNRRTSRNCSIPATHKSRNSMVLFLQVNSVLPKIYDPGQRIGKVLFEENYTAYDYNCQNFRPFNERNSCPILEGNTINPPQFFQKRIWLYLTQQFHHTENKSWSRNITATLSSPTIWSSRNGFFKDQQGDFF